MRKKFLGPTSKLIAKLFITCLLLYLLFIKVDLGIVKALIPKINLGVLLLSLIIFLTRNWFAAKRWQILLASKNYDIPVIPLIRSYFVGYFFSFFLPTIVGGDIARGYYLYEAGVDKKECASSIIVERILGVAAMMVFALISIIFSFNLVNNSLIRFIVIIPSVVCLVLLILFYKNQLNFLSWLPEVMIRKLNKLIRVVQSIHQYNQTPRVLMKGFFYSVVFQLGGIFSVYLIALSIGSNLAFVYFLMLLPIVWLVSLIPISLNGLGVREGVFVFLFAAVGMAKETALIISVIYLLESVAQGVLGAIFFLLDQQKIAAIKEYP